MKIRFENNGLILLTIAAAVILGLFAPAASADTENMSITSDTQFVYVGTSASVTFTVENIGTAACMAIGCPTSSPVNGAQVQLSGAATGSGTTDADGNVTIIVTATSQGTITATASAAGYNDASIPITAKARPQLNLTASVDNLYVNTSRNVTFTVNHPCGTAPGDSQCTGNALFPDPGTTITISGVASGSGVTAINNNHVTGMTASVTIPINATAPGNVVVTAQKEGYTDGVINIPADYLPVAVFTVGTINYSIGDPVDFALTNAGPVTISPDVLQIWNRTSSRWVLSTNIIGINPLAPGQSVNISWNQKGDNGNQVPPAAYRARIVYSYNNKSFANYTDWFNIIDCINKIFAPKQVSSVVTQDMIFDSGDLKNTSKAWDVVWYVNGTEVYKETGVTHISNYTNNSAVEGVWNVTAVAKSGCNTITWSFVWTVTQPPNCFDYANPTKDFKSYLDQAVKFQTGNLTDSHITWNFTWYLNGTEVFNETNAMQSHYINRSAALGVYNVTAVAVNGCKKVGWKYLWTVSNLPPNPPGNSGSGGGGGGGGGGGIITAEPYTNILKFERQDADFIKGSPVTYSFTNPVFSIYQVLVTGRENEGQIGLRIEHLKNASALVNRNPPGAVYANENLWIGSKRVDYIVIRFRVNNSFLSDNGLETKDLYLLRFNDGWTKLNTKVINSDGNYTYFEAKSPGMSSFAVSGLKNATQVSASPPGDITGNSDVPQEETPAGTGDGKKSPGFEIAAAGAVLVLAACYRKRR